MITIRRLCRDVHRDYRINLIAGADGLDNSVDWVHIIEDCSVADFLHGNELLLTTGIGNLMLSDNLYEFITKVNESHASGVMVNIGPYIKEIPKKIIEYCNENKLPLYTIPWNVKLVDLTRKFCHMLIELEEKEKSLTSIIKDFLFKPDLRGKCYSDLTRNGFSQHLNFCAINVGVSLETDLSESSELREKVHSVIVREMSRFTSNYVVFMNENHYSIVTAGVNTTYITEFVETISHKNYGDGITLYVGVSSNRGNLNDLPDNFDLASKVYKMCKKMNSSPLYFDKLGMYKILLSVSNRRIIKEYRNDILGTLYESDESNGTDYIEFIKTFVENDASVQKVADALFVHRNTIHYKMNKIKEISGINLTNLDDLFKIKMCLNILNI